MNLAEVSTALAFVTVIGTAVNVYLTLRIRVEMLELEARIMKQVREEFTPREICDGRMGVVPVAARG